MSDIVLRKVYAVDSNTGKFLSTGQILVTNAIGGTNWMDAASSLSVAGGPIVGYLPSTISTFSTLVYLNNAAFEGVSSMSTDMYYAISSLGLAISNITPGNISPISFRDSTISTTAGLGSAGYFSTSGLSSLSSIGFIVWEQLISSQVGSANTGTTIGSSNLVSSIDNLGITYMSTSSVTSTINNLGLTYPSTASLTSSILGLSYLGYISSSQLTSTTRGLSQLGYVSSTALTSSLLGLSVMGYISTAALVSTIEGMSTFTQTCVRFDRTVNAYVQNCQVIFSGTTSIGYFSTFTQSTLTVTQTFGTQYAGEVIDTINLKFSTLQLDLAPFANFMTQSSILTLDVYPHIAFSRLADSATSVAVLPISTFIQRSSTILSTPMVTTFVYAGNTTTKINGIDYPASNFYNTPIKLQFPPQSVIGSTNQLYSLVHVLPNGITGGGNTNALSNEFVTPYFGRIGSVFVSIQNNP